MLSNTPILRLDLDVTGKSVNNLISNEPHTLSNRPTRSIATRLGPFFGESVIIRDGATELQRGRDFQIVELHQEATLLYAKEIASVILIINSTVSSSVTVTYQALGGHFSQSGTNESIANLYQTVIQDNRPVDWTNIFNKPTEFNPTIHRHLLDDVFGFEPIVDHLERIKRAITLGQTGVVLEIVNSLLSRFTAKELPLVIPSTRIVQYDALLYFLSRKKLLNNTYIDKLETDWKKGQSFTVEIDTSSYSDGTELYWELHNSETKIPVFSSIKGKVTSKGDKTYFSIYVPSELNVPIDKTYIGLKESELDKEYKAVTYQLSILEPDVGTSLYGVLLLSSLNFSPIDKFNSHYDSHPDLRLWRRLTMT